MTIALPLSQEDRNRLLQEKANLLEQNSRLGDANEVSLVNIAEKLKNDISYKKQTDAPHTDIYLYEEELKRLVGSSLPQPLQEQGFIIGDSVGDARLFVNDGRLQIQESAATVVDIPIVPFRGSSQSQSAGTNFDIWSRDRFGSTTSKINGSTSFTVNTSNSKLNVQIDGVANEVDISSVVVLPQTIPGAAVAALLQGLLNGIGSGGFTKAAVGFYEGLNTFTIASGTVGSSSSAVVLPASSNDLRITIGFDVQHSIVGKYQNNLLNVEIDGVAKEIKIADFRLCEHDASLGDNNDDLGFFWSGLSTPLGYMGATRVGPLFCSGLNNGTDVAKSIQAKLREIGTGGFKNAICFFFTDNNSFLIYSGTFGTSSSVHVLAASDPLRDARTLLGFDPPAQEIGNEQFYGTLGDLVGQLSTYPNVTVSGLSVPSRLSHSILYLPPGGVKIASSFQDFVVPTTKIYDDGSRGLPRLYPNGTVVVDSTNNLFNFFEGDNVEKTAVIAFGTYHEGDLAIAMQDAMNAAAGIASQYAVIYSSMSKVFVLSSNLAGGTFSLLCNSGKDCLNSIWIFIGFDTDVDRSGSASYLSDSQVTFSSSDFFNPTIPVQFNGIPLFTDFTVDEQSALLREQEILTQENNSLLSRMIALAAYDNEVIIDAWEEAATEEAGNTYQQYTALRIQRGVYAAHISESDAEITAKTNAINSVQPNLASLSNLLVAHNTLLNVGSQTQTFTAGVDFTDGGNESLTISVVPGPNNLKIYNNPPPLVKYTTQTNHIPGSFVPSGLFGSSATYTPEPLPVFDISNTRTGTKGYVYSAPELSQQYIISNGSDTAATILGSAAETYSMAVGNTIKLKIDGTAEQTATISATAGYTESRVAVTSGFVVEVGLNDTIDFTEGSGNLVATITAGSYTGTALATQIQTRLNASGASNYSVNYNVSTADKFTITSDGSGGTGIFSLLWNTGANAAKTLAKTIGFEPSGDSTGGLVYTSNYAAMFTVITGVNDKFTIAIDGVSSNVITIAQANYDTATLISQMQAQIDLDPHFAPGDYTITYPANKFRITSTTLGTDSTVTVTEGTKDFLRTIALDADAPIVGGGNVGDITKVLAAEVANILNTLTGVSSSDDGGYVRISTTSTRGSISTIQMTGGTALATIGFTVGQTGTGTDKVTNLKVDIDGDTTQLPITLASSASPIPAAVVAADIQTKLQQLLVGGYINALCSFNETTFFQTFTDSLRILSGTYGVGSTVSIGDETIVITAGVNDKIDFRESVLVGPLLAVLTPGTYSPSSLAAEIKTQLDSAVGAGSTYTVTFSTFTNKLSIASNGVGGMGIFRLLFATGPNVASSVASTIGYYLLDHINLLTYGSDGFVKTNNVKTILGLDTPTAEPGHGVIDVQATLTSTTFTSELNLDTGGGTRTDLVINVVLPPNDEVLALINTINAYSFVTEDNFYQAAVSNAFLLGRTSKKFKIDDGDTLEIQVDGGATQSIPFVAIQGSSISGTNAQTRIVSGVNDRIRVNVNGIGTTELILGTNTNGYDVAAEIQKQVRDLTDANIEKYAALLGFVCIFTGNQYVLASGTAGTGSSVVVINGSINNAAASLKLGLANGGTEAAGSGDFVNSRFATDTEIAFAINATAVGFTATASTYIKLQSDTAGSTSELQIVGGLAKAKLGFDLNDSSFPSSELIGELTSIILPFGPVSIKSPAIATGYRGWRTDLGNVEIVFATDDNTNLVARQSVVTTRLAFISTRVPQISTRAADVITALTPTLYQQRVAAVQTRLAKKTGSYAKVGDEFKSQENNASLASDNTNQITVIDGLLV